MIVESERIDNLVHFVRAGSLRRAAAPVSAHVSHKSLSKLSTCKHSVIMYTSPHVAAVWTEPCTCRPYPELNTLDFWIHAERSINQSIK